MKARVSALYVRDDGPYPSRVQDVWTEERDARNYPGKWPVVAHPPCARWGRYWSGGPSATVRREKGDDAGCFAAALDAVRKWGGVLEHPEASHAWSHFGLKKPNHSGGWIEADDFGFTCCVEQGHYGHPARKKTWLYLVGWDAPPPMKWGQSMQGVRLDEGFHSAEELAAARREQRTGICQRLSKRQCELTPDAFAEWLIYLADKVDNRN